MSSEISKSRRRWTEEEDKSLQSLVAAAEKEKCQIVWKEVAEQMEMRNANQCRERWFHHLRPGIKRGNWSSEEDEAIERLQKQLGSRWSKIVCDPALSGRTDIDIKNRWHTLQRRSTKRKETISVPRVGMKVIVTFQEEHTVKLYDGTITKVDNDEEQPGDAFKLQIQYEDGSFEETIYPDEDIFLVESNKDGLTEEEVCLSAEILNIHYSLQRNYKIQRITSKNCEEEKIRAKENRHTNISW